MTFVNLHVHTNYSWDSTSRIKDIVSFAKKNNQPAIAMTDHGNMSGAIEFYKTCKDANIKPIIGCEFYICKDQMSASDTGPHNKSLNHLVVLAKNAEGYKNLLYLTKYANENFYYRPRIDEETLFANSNGLIVINGHMDTSINDCLFYNEKAVHDCQSTDEARQYLFPDYKDRLRAVYDRYYSVFGEDFYLEVQLFDKKDIFQQTYGHVLYEYAKENNFKCVGTGDAHYIKEEDAIFHKTFCAISMNTKIKDMSDIRYYNSGQYKLITNEHAEDCYPQELIEATLEIVNKIDEYSIIYPESVPVFSTEIKNPRQYIHDLCQQLLECKGITDNSYQERLRYELDILEMGDLFNYFLIVYDFCKWAKDNNILMGPARGCLANTNIVLKNGGIKDIADISIGDIVINKHGQPTKVLNKFKYDVNEELLKINTFFGETNGITLTKDHKVLAIKREISYISNGKTYYSSNISAPEWIEAKDLKVGYYLVQPKIEHEVINHKFDLAKYNCSLKNGIKIYNDDQYVYTIISGNQFTKTSEIQCNRFLDLNNELCYVLGVFIGDGWLNKHKKSISFCFNSLTGLESQNKIIQYMESIGCRTTIEYNHDNKNVNQVHFTNLIIYNLFKDIFSEYSYTAQSKTLPDFAYQLNNNQKHNLLTGIIDADGHIKKSTTTICSVSKHMIYQIKYLLQTIGHPASIYSENRTDEREEYKNRSTTYYCSFPNLGTVSRNTRCVDNNIYIPIKSITKINNIKHVYDFEVDGDHSYLTTSGIVHNSAGGCLVSYLLGIIEMDPIKYGLLFERFYSPDRAKYKIMPDIDSDFPASKRSLVIDYIKNKYGHDYVKSVVTFSTLQGRNALKDVLRVHGAASFQEINNITENIPSRDKISDKLADFKKETGSDSILYYCLKHEPDLLKDYCRLHVDENGIETLSGEYAKYINIAIHLEGAIKSESKHASALIISKYPIYTVAPLIKDKSSDELMVGYDMDSFPHASLVKFDILGVKSFDCLMEINTLLKEIGIT